MEKLELALRDLKLCNQVVLRDSELGAFAYKRDVNECELALDGFDVYVSQ